MVALAAALWILQTASVVLIPLAASFFIAVLVYPLQQQLSARLPQFATWAALPLTMGLVLVILGSLLWLFAEAVDEVVEAIPRYRDQFTEVWRDVQRTARTQGLPIPADMLARADLQRHLGPFAASVVQSVWKSASLLVLVLFLVLLMLLEAEEWRRKLLAGHHARAGNAALEAVGVVTMKVRRYLWVRTALGIASALIAGAWLAILQVDLVLVWMVLTFSLNYIPNVGSIIAVIPPSLLAIVQHGPLRGLIVLGGLTVFEQIIGNVIEPRMEGRRLEISPVVALMSLVFWSWLWGVAGAVLAIPMTLALSAVCAEVLALAPASALLGRRPESAADTAAPEITGARRAL